METEVKEFSTNCQVSSLEKIYAITGNLKAYYILNQWNPNWKTLAENIEVEKKFALVDCLKIMKLIASSMQEIGACGNKFHHGHLHPGNILVN